mmetsp:Transcript_15383/g.26267  ORF Transcript_15383/g.26267 Transcript_15383/m.26267 type:complete len:286 (-) Transcript_15383:1017-1874(-)
MSAATKLSKPMRWAAGGWAFFIAENFILSENRTYLIENFGDDAYHYAYGTLSTAAMSSVVYGYFRKVKDAPPLLFKGPVPLGAKVASFMCLSLGLGMASQIPPKIQIPVEFVTNNSADENNTIATSAAAEAVVGPAPPTEEGGGGGWKVRCPFDFTDNKDTNSPVHGLERISRHPGLWSFGLLGLGSAFLVPSLPQRVWLAMPSMVALIGGAHTDSRFRRGMGGELSEEYDKVTSNVPLLAMLSGAQGNVIDVLNDFSSEIKPLNAAVAVGTAGLWVMSKGRVRR